MDNGSPSKQKNDQVRRSLAQHGDDGRAMRHVVHYAYPIKNERLADRGQMIESLKAQGLLVRDAVAENGMVMEHYVSVDPESFDGFTETLEKWFKQCGWEYDGWECEIRQGPAH